MEEKTTRNTSFIKSFRRLLFGDYLLSGFITRHPRYLLFLFVLGIVYITNRYQLEMRIKHMNQMRNEVTNIRYEVLTISSELTVRTRQSHIEEYMNDKEDAVKVTDAVPYKIPQP